MTKSPNQRKERISLCRFYNGEKSMPSWIPDSRLMGSAGTYFEEEKDWVENNRNTNNTEYFKIAKEVGFPEEVINAVPPSLLIWKYHRYLNACCALGGPDDPQGFLNCYLSDYLLMPTNKEKKEIVSNQPYKNQYDIEDWKKHLVKFCLYYHGENYEPRRRTDFKTLLFWMYEKSWVDAHLSAETYTIKSMHVDAIDYKLKTEIGDKTPLTLKAVLLNRFVSWNKEKATAENTLKDFEEWYKKVYKKPDQKGQGFFPNAFFFDEIIEKYQNINDAAIYYSYGGNTGCCIGRISPDKIDNLGEDEVFVFGSNKQGHHIGGAARAAMDKFGAKWGVGDGLCGQSYAISTMEGLIELAANIDRFIRFATDHKELYFFVTPIGCGIAGYNPLQIAPLFKDAIALPNVYLPKIFWEYYWQTNSRDLCPTGFIPNKGWKKWNK